MADLNLWQRRINIVLLVIIFVAGIFLRIPPQAFSSGAELHFLEPLHPQPAWRKIGFDEALYREYVNALSKAGITSYPDIVAEYIDVQKKLPGSILPPLRFLYIFTAYLWHSIFGTEALEALHQVAALFNMLTLVLVTLFVWRIRGPIWATAIAALMAVAPTQLHMSQHALVDGFFTFWATLVLWLLWENLQRTSSGKEGSEATPADELKRVPANWPWLACYVGALALLVITKENSFFVWVAVVALLITNRWLHFGTVSRELVIATFVGPLLGVVILIFLAGGIDVFVQSYQLSIGKNFQLRYAILTGDGPWYRYLVDLMLVSPIILVLAFGTIFRLNRTIKPELFMAIFIAASYVVMCNVKYGMNLRYANMWDMPLRFLAFSEIMWLGSLLKRFQAVAIVLALVLLVGIEFHQYIVLAVRYPLYELITHDLLQALSILKTP